MIKFHELRNTMINKTVFQIMRKEKGCMRLKWLIRISIKKLKILRNKGIRQENVVFFINKNKLNKPGTS